MVPDTTQAQSFAQKAGHWIAIDDNSLAPYLQYFERVTTPERYIMSNSPGAISNWMINLMRAS